MSRDFKFSILGSVAAVAITTYAIMPAFARQDAPAPPAPPAPQRVATEADETQAPPGGFDVPGQVHMFLAKRAGNYATQTVFRQGPNAEPDVSEGTATITAILDGRFIVEENTGYTMGKPVQGHRVMGYNNRSERFEATWTYTYSTATMFLRGDTEDLGKTINLEGAFDASSTQRLPIKARITQVDKDRFTVEMLSTSEDGDEYAVLYTTYTRTE